MKTALKLIGEERSRQLAVEGFSFNHDDQHTQSELANAAACYALDYRISEKEIWDKPLLDLIWPWEPEWWKPDQSRIRNLVKAGALICAEIERLQRLEARAEAVQMKPGARGLADS